MRPIRLLVPANIRHNSGGNVYNARLVEGLRSLGAEVEVLPVEGSWPESTPEERRRLGTLLSAWAPEDQPSVVTILDGLIAMGAPDELEFAANARRETWVLVHMPAPAHHELEARSLRAASGIVCTSSWAADVLAARHGSQGLRIALPGTGSAPRSEGSVPPHIVTVAALLRRVRVAGELRGQALEEEWNRADLSVLVSEAEAFGMVVTESLPHGIPVVIRAGTGAVEALTFAAPVDGESIRFPGTAVQFPQNGDPENPDVLAGVLRRWLLDSETRSTWRSAAVETRGRLPGWDRQPRKCWTCFGGER